MALITCDYCGNRVSDKATSCPHCGAALTFGGAMPTAESEHFGTLTFKWKGMWMLMDGSIRISMNGARVENCESYSLIDGFTFSTPITSNLVNIGVKVKNSLMPTNKFSCNFEKGKNYTCTLRYNRFFGAFSFEVTDEQGNLVARKGYPIVNQILAFIIFMIVLMSLRSMFYRPVYRLYY